MDRYFISNIHVEKLGHKLLEIRERALLTIKCKLENGWHFENEPASSKEIIGLLFNWFLFEEISCEDIVLDLIEMILKSEHGSKIVYHFGKARLIKELDDVKSYVEQQYHSKVEKLISIVTDTELKYEVPPLESTVPLSYRSDGSEYEQETASIQGFLKKSASVEPTNPVSNGVGSGTYRISQEDYSNEALPFYYIPWQSLIEPDKHVLESVERTFKNPSVSEMVHSCEFFTRVLLHDFPAEVFIQRPAIIKQFLIVLNSSDSRTLTNSVLTCLLQLIKALELRINQLSDYNLCHTKQLSPEIKSLSTPCSTASKSTEDFEYKEDVILLKTEQIPTPLFCFLCLKSIFAYLTKKPEKESKINQEGINLSLEIVVETVKLLKLLILSQKESDLKPEILDNIEECLARFTETLEFFRMETEHSVLGLNYKSAYLYFLSVLVKFLLISPKGSIPASSKDFLINCLVDTSLARLYPTLHQNLLHFVEGFESKLESEAKQTYKDTNTVVNGMIATSRFLKNKNVLNAKESLKLISSSLSCIGIIGEIRLIEGFVEICQKISIVPNNSHLFESAESTLLKLLSYPKEEIQTATYKLIHKLTIDVIGPRFNVDYNYPKGAQIEFLLSGPVLTEIVLNGTSHSSTEIQGYSQDILIHILKCKLLVNEEIWNKAIVALIQILPLLCCLGTKATSLGRAIINVTDPDTSKSLCIPEEITAKCNIGFLFSKDALIREEAFSRLFWLLATQTNSRLFLPKLTAIYDKAVAHIFQPNGFEPNKLRRNQHYYTMSNLVQIMDILKDNNKVEPMIRRSALNQLSVVLEDPLLHQAFIDFEGIGLISKVMEQALTDQDFQDYPDSIIPCISILKNLCLYQARTRDTVSHQISILYFILRGLLLFAIEERVKIDCSILLFLITFKDFIQGNPQQGCMSIAELLDEKLLCPIKCPLYKNDSYKVENFDRLLSDRWALHSLKVQWNSEVFHGFDRLLNLPEINYKNIEMQMPDLLKIQDSDLRELRGSSINYCMKHLLQTVNKSKSHQEAIEAIEKLKIYIELSKEFDCNPLTEDWETAFEKYFRALPSSSEDVKLLQKVIDLLTKLITCYKKGDSWIVKIFKTPKQVVLDFLSADDRSEEENKLISQEVHKLLVLCVYQAEDAAEASCWGKCIEALAGSLRFTDSQHFYNLAHLDSLLDCLSHLTGNLGWSSKIDNRKIIGEMFESLYELIKAFHCGKGDSAALSVMGLSITRRALIVLNHVINEMQSGKVKHWEMLVLDESQTLDSFIALWKSRDVVSRAAALQLFSTLASSSKLSNFIKNISTLEGSVLELSLNLILDETEAGIVRENSALLLSNLTAFDSWKTINNLLNNYNFYERIRNCLKALFTAEPKSSMEAYNSSYRSDSNLNITSPGFIKAVVLLLHNILALCPDDFSSKLQDYGIVKDLFRSICNPNISIDNTKELSLYCDLLEMNSTICQFLSKAAFCNAVCLGTILHTQDCLNSLFSLLNTKTYHTNLPQLIYLRNKLWFEIYSLISILLERDQADKFEAFEIISNTLLQGSEFVEGLCEALSCPNQELQNASVTCLANLMGHESRRINSGLSKLSLQSFLDSTESPRSLVPVYEDQENIDPNLPKQILEELYFDKLPQSTSNKACLKFGGEICKILIYLNNACSLGPDEGKRKSLIVSALSSVLSVSREAKSFALNNGLLPGVIKELREVHIKLSLDSVEALRRVSDKKRVSPLLKKMDDLIGLLINFTSDCLEVKLTAVDMNLPDLLHKLWNWFCVQNSYLINVLKLLATLTSDCEQANQALPYTNSLPGTGPRKTPSSLSLLHVIIALIGKQMDLISRTHQLDILELCFVILHNTCAVLDCRVLISKSNIFQSLGRLHPAITKRQKPFEDVEFLWLDFLQTFSSSPEGQAFVAKAQEAFELLLTISSGVKLKNRIAALTVLRNLAFYQTNKSRLITCPEFLALLKSRLSNGSYEEKNIVVVIVWALAANSQKAKVMLKAAQIDEKLQIAAKHFSVSQDCKEEDLKRVLLVLSILRDVQV